MKLPRQKRDWTWMISAVILNYFIYHATLASPVFVSQLFSGGSGRNIRHLPCVSRRTGETGVCMFAFTCAKANGTHLGTCIDRFYFGSCCKIEVEEAEEEPDVFPQDNAIEEDVSLPVRPPSSKPASVVASTSSTAITLESNDIPGNVDRPEIPGTVKQTTAAAAAAATTTTATATTKKAEPIQSLNRIEPEDTTTPRSEQTKVKPHKTSVSKKPSSGQVTTATTDVTTESTRLSTFQTVQKASSAQPLSTSSPTFISTTKKSSFSSSSSLKPSIPFKSTTTKNPTKHSPTLTSFTPSPSSSFHHLNNNFATATAAAPAATFSTTSNKVSSTVQSTFSQVHTLDKIAFSKPVTTAASNKYAVVTSEKPLTGNMPADKPISPFDVSATLAAKPVTTQASSSSSSSSSSAFEAMPTGSAMKNDVTSSVTNKVAAAAVGVTEASKPSTVHFEKTQFPVTRFPPRNSTTESSSSSSSSTFPTSSGTHQTMTAATVAFDTKATLASSSSSYTKKPFTTKKPGKLTTKKPASLMTTAKLPETNGTDSSSSSSISTSSSTSPTTDYIPTDYTSSLTTTFKISPASTAASSNGNKISSATSATSTTQDIPKKPSSAAAGTAGTAGTAGATLLPVHKRPSTSSLPTKKPFITLQSKRPTFSSKRPTPALAKKNATSVSTHATATTSTTAISNSSKISNIVKKPTTTTTTTTTTTNTLPYTVNKNSTSSTSSQSLIPSATSSPIAHTKTTPAMTAAAAITTKTTAATSIAKPNLPPATTIKAPSSTISNELLPNVTAETATKSSTSEFDATTPPSTSPHPTLHVKPIGNRKNITTSTPSGTFATSVALNQPNAEYGPEMNATTTIPAAIVTWTSVTTNEIDNSTNNSSEILSPISDSTETSWSPITTPDGWIIIQSPSTEKPPTPPPSPPAQIGVNTEVKPVSSLTDSPFSSNKPASAESTTTIPTTQHTSQASTTHMDVLSTLATVTVSPDFIDNTFASLNMSSFKEVCGRRLFPESRIVGGDGSTFGKWPWQISLRQWRTSTYLHKCGAALLNENWAITAAHCVQNVLPSDLLLRIGEHDLGNEEEPYAFQERRVQIVASHPNFDPRTFEFDLALMRFYEPVLPFQPNVLPICIPDDDEGYVGQTAFVTGWGRLYEDGPLPSVLQEVAVPVINNTVCESMYRNAGYIEHIPHIFICAGWRKGGFDSCEGDSGGPLVIQRKRDKRWVLAGVISWGIGCAEPNQPGVYTRISEFREWINQILQF